MLWGGSFVCFFGLGMISIKKALQLEHFWKISFLYLVTVLSLQY